MAAPSIEQTTDILNLVAEGHEQAADRLLPLLYDEFRAMAGNLLRHERAGHSLQPTALVHEAYLRLVDQHRVHWRGRTHFMAVGAQLMRRILVDHARGKKREKRGGERCRVPLDEALVVSPDRPDDLLAVDEALEKLASLDARQARIVELRFFGGLTVEEVAEVLGVSKRTVEAEWTVIRAWLRRELSDEGEGDEHGKPGGDGAP